jgi:hypothetical protein
MPIPTTELLARNIKATWGYTRLHTKIDNLTVYYLQMITYVESVKA